MPWFVIVFGVAVGPAMDEVLASLQALARVRRAGGSVWRAFWGVDPAGELAPEAGRS
jgi:hypothetical protein